jgi:DNA topoisomerase-1
MVTLARALRLRPAMGTRRVIGKSYMRPPDLHPERSAQAAGLRYVADAVPGISREGEAGAFRYRRAGGKAVRDEATLTRIRSLAIPPAWREVWICARDDGHLQATGRDARGRKQYRYHPRWRETRDETKYGRLVAFARALPRIRRRTGRDLARPGLPREKALAAVVRLLEATLIRVGNEEYARENESFGLTTLRGRQVRIDGATLRFCFRGKSGVQHAVELTDGRLAAIVRRMRELPGEELFGYVDEAGGTRPIESGDVNDYLKASAGEAFTSKDFRTWAGTVLCARELRRLAPPASGAEGRRHLTRAVASVAKALGNTKAVCRKCYIHPRVIDTYLDGRLHDLMNGAAEEAAVVRVLRAEPRPQAPLGTLLRRSIQLRRTQARRLPKRGHVASAHRPAARA